MCALHNKPTQNEVESLLTEDLCTHTTMMGSTLRSNFVPSTKPPTCLENGQNMKSKRERALSILINEMCERDESD